MKRRVVKRWINNTEPVFLVQERRFFFFWRNMIADSGEPAYFKYMANAIACMEEHNKVMYE
jgi:hypothetical protein